MAARMNFAQADVVTPQGRHEKVSVLVNNNVATLRQRGTGQVVAELSGVEAVEKTGRRTWVIRAGDVTWDVTRAGGCGCG